MGSPYGDMAIWVKSEKEFAEDEKDVKMFVPIRIWVLERKSSVVSISVSPNSELIAVGFTSNDIATFSMSNALPSTTEAFESKSSILKIFTA